MTTLAAQGCTVTTSNTPVDAGPDPCLSCLDRQCAPQYSVCLQDTDCNAILSCVAPCTTTDCENNCLNQHSQTGRDKFVALGNCDVYNGCSPSASCGSVCQGNPSLNCSQAQDASSQQTCQQCTDQFCSSQKANCVSGSECDKYTQCTIPCADHPEDQQCIPTCKQAHEQGYTDSLALATCTSDKCPGC